VAPVELIRLAGLERHRDEGQCVVASVLAPLLPPAARIAADGIVGTLEPLPHQQVVDARHPQPIAPAARLVIFKKRVETILKRTDPRQWLHLALIVECRLWRPDRLAHYLPRKTKVTNDRLDRLPRRMLTPNPYYCLHYQHPVLATWSNHAAS